MGKKWSKDEDEILYSSVSRVGKNQTINWIKISDLIPGRTNKDCRKRWTKISSARRTGSWDEQEDSMLKLAIELVGTRWMVVSTVVGSRTPDQCQKRWQNALKPELSNAEWTEAEDERLKAAVKILGRNWTSISNSCFKQRSALSLSNRHAILCRDPKQSGSSKIAALPSPTPTDSAQSPTSLDMPLYSPPFTANQQGGMNIATDPPLDIRTRDPDFGTFETEWNPHYPAQAMPGNPLPESMDDILISPSSDHSGLMPAYLQHNSHRGENQHSEILNSIPPDTTLSHNAWDPWYQNCAVVADAKSTVLAVSQGPEYTGVEVEARNGSVDERMTLVLENLDQHTRDEILGLLGRKRGHTVIKVDMKTR
ncbi:hypothetical protein V8E51_008777 [Hyaloscypha variabilis]